MSGERNVADATISGQGVAGRHATFGVGRGELLSSLCFGRGRPVVPGINDSTVDQSAFQPPLIPAATSTPVVQAHAQPTQVVTTEVLSNIISDLAKKIGDSITSNLSNMHLPSHTQPQPPVSHPPSHIDPSQVKIVVQSDAKAPPYFRGDHSDAFSIQEWEGMMRCYLSRLTCETHTEMFDLIMSRLTGKARDVVKVSLRCRLGLSGDELITTVFDILRRNFSELTYSSLPMKDFYSTVPRAGEDAMDYWIRLNKSIDAADECLRRRGRLVEDPSAEVVMMFINHCPDPSLALSFQLKAAEEWTAAEIQDRLDSHVRKVKRTVVHSQHAVHPSALSQSPTDASCRPLFGVSSAMMGEPAPHSLPALSSVDITGQPQPPGRVVNTPQPSASYGSPHAQAVPQLPTPPPHQAAEPGTQQLVAMFDKVLSLCTTSLSTGQRRPHQPSRPRGQNSAQRTSCEVCGSGDHTTHAHCRLYRLCLNCFSPGHMRRECPQTFHSTGAAAASPQNADLN